MYMFVGIFLGGGLVINGNLFIGKLGNVGVIGLLFFFVLYSIYGVEFS